jgi:hypothetical protein
MQGIVDLVGAVSNIFTRTIWIVILGGILVVGIISLMIGYTAPVVVDQVGERAERISGRAIEAAREESRAHALAAEGWGYSEGPGTSESSFAPDTAATHDDTYDESYGEPAEDWGEPSE